MSESEYIFRFFVGTYVSESEYIFRFFVGTCLCHQRVYSAWYEASPYAFTRNGETSGIIPMLIKSMIPVICGKCKVSGNRTSALSFFDRTKTGRNPKSTSEFGLKSKISNDVHFSFPISQNKLITTYEDVYQYVPILDTTSSAVIIFDPTQISKTNAIFHSVLNCWPVLVMVVSMTTLAGILIWLTVSILETFFSLYIEKFMINPVLPGLLNTLWTLGLVYYSPPNSLVFTLKV